MRPQLVSVGAGPRGTGVLERIVYAASASPSSASWCFSTVLLTEGRGGCYEEDGQGRLRCLPFGREPRGLKIMSGATVVLGDRAEETQERAAAIRLQQIPPQRAIHAPEQVWDADLSSHGPDGPLPSFAPDPRSAPAADGTGHCDAVAVAASGRTLSEEKGLSIRETVIEATARQSFVGTPEAVAARMTEFAAAGAAGGFILTPQVTPSGLDEFVERVVPLLQERGSFRTGYSGTTLRSHLGLRDPVWKG